MSTRDCLECEHIAYTCPASSYLCKAQRRYSNVGYKVKLWCVAFLGMNVIHWLVTKAPLPMTTDPKRWFNSALVSNPFPVTHNFLLTPQQLGQPAGEKTYRCCWLELEGLWGPPLCNQPRVPQWAAECGCSPLCRQDMGGDVCFVRGCLSHSVFEQSVL